MSKKSLAICVSGYNKNVEYKIISGIYEKCKEYDFNLLVFASMMPKSDLHNNTEDMQNVLRGESEIYNLINYNKIDGMIVFGESIPENHSFEKIVASCKEHKIPLINIGDLLHVVDHNIAIRNTASMSLVVEHLIKDHGFTKINYIGGIPDNKESEERLFAYKNTLQKYEIPVEENRIGYGYFWKQSEECVKEFLKEEELPEAIVCANDTMAILVMDYLKNEGYSIPQDIVVTGFDGTPDADIYKPSITTIRHDFLEAGKNAFMLIKNLIDGTPSEDFEIEAKLCVQESCGCKKRGDLNKIKVYDYLNDTYGARHDGLLFNANIAKMNLIFSKAENSLSLFNGLATGIQSFDFKKFYICICSELEREKEVFYKDEKENLHYGISKKMVSVIRYGHDVPVGTVFSSEKMLPNDFLNEESPTVTFFSPMYFQDKFLGYTAFEPKDVIFSGELFLVWLQIASNDIGSFYVKNELENMYIRDPLTGLYNRRGMQKMFSKFSTLAMEQKKGYVTAFCVDIDFLKTINDRFGHEAGDNAIIRTADAIRMAMPKNSINVRTGGDEFCMFYYSEEEEDIQKYVDGINKYLSTYNEKSKMPYKVMCSTGFYTRLVSENLDYRKMLKIADKELYKEKSRRFAGEQIVIRKYDY